MSQSLPELTDGLIPNLSGWDEQLDDAARRREPVYLGRTPIRLDRVQSAFAVALHMHQPLVLDDGDIRAARLMGNLEYMLARSHVHDFHDAPVYAQCYTRIADFVRDLVNAGRSPRVMLDYSGAILYGFRQMGRGDILDNLKSVTLDDRFRSAVEWLGTLWGHAVVPSTPVPDIELHIRAWRHHFAAIFGWEAVGRVRGFSPPELGLPNHPDVAYEYVRALKANGYRWLLVQEHTAEEEDGSPLRERYLPRRLVARDSRGEELSITALIKTQGSDTKLVGHMQPRYEAAGMQPRDLAGRRVPPLALQISDGENGGVMMNEFPPHFMGTWRETGTEGVVGLNGTEYLELLEAAGVKESDFQPIRPKHHHALWQRVGGDVRPDRVAKAIEECGKADHRFHMDGGSWTDNISWVRGYDNVLDPMRRLSARFHEVLDGRPFDKKGKAYQNALLHLLTAESSDYRYWGQGRWTENAREICRRGMDILQYDFAQLPSPAER